jgi:hypothetical protein
LCSGGGHTSTAIGLCTTAETRRAERRPPRLRFAEADERPLRGVVGVEPPGVVVERAVDHVHERGVEAVRHRQCREAAVVVDDVEMWTTASGPHEGLRDVRDDGLRLL